MNVQKSTVYIYDLANQSAYEKGLFVKGLMLYFNDHLKIYTNKKIIKFFINDLNFFNI